MAAPTREVVTLQFGHYSNFVGTHWWNLQEASFVYERNAAGDNEINHDVLFREGINPSREVTYTPRLISFDLKGSLNTLRQEGVLYVLPDTEHDVPWQGDVTMHKFSPSHKNEFLKDLDKQVDVDGESYNEADSEDPEEKDVESGTPDPVPVQKTYNLEDKVQVWSDYLRIHLHPKTIHIIDSYDHQSEDSGFDVYNQGVTLQKNYEHEKETEDRLHFFLEECDHLQGFQVLVDVSDGFGGLAAGTLQQLTDEYGTKGILTTTMSPTTFYKNKPADAVTRLVNSVLAYTELTEYSTAVIPMSLSGTPWKHSASTVTFPHLSYKDDLHYHTSAILAATLETMTLPFRLTSHPSLIGHMTGALATMGRKMLALQSSLPFPLLRHGHMVSSLVALEGALPWGSLTPSCIDRTSPFSQSIAVRGVDKTQPSPFSQSLSIRGIGKQHMHSFDDATAPKLLREATSLNEVVQLYCNETFPGVPSAVHSASLPVKTVAPFPEIFSPQITKDGCLCHKHDKPRSQSQGVDSVPMMTSLQCTPSISTTFLDRLHEDASRLNIKRLHHFTEAGLEDDAFTESLHEIKTISQRYHQHDMM